MTIPNTVLSIGDGAFSWYPRLTGIYFKGNVPIVGWEILSGDTNATVYYLPGITTGWGATFAGRPPILWNAAIWTNDAAFGARTNCFGFNITGTNTLNGGSSNFRDPAWTNYPARF